MQMESQKEKEEIIAKMRINYDPVAEISSAIYFSLLKLSQIDCMY